MQMPPIEDRLAAALAESYPSQSALATTLRYHMGPEITKIPMSEDMGDYSRRVVEWAVSDDRLEELIKAARFGSPSAESLAEVEKAYYRSQRQQGTARSSVSKGFNALQPGLPTALKRSVVDAVSRVSGIEDFSKRSALLMGIPFSSSLQRSSDDVLADIDLLVSQLGSLGRLPSGSWPLLILTDNARSYAVDPGPKSQLDKVYSQLEKFYGVDRPSRSMQKDVPW